MWSCEKCTFYNTYGVTVCEMCDTEQADNSDSWIISQGKGKKKGVPQPKIRIVEGKDIRFELYGRESVVSNDTGSKGGGQKNNVQSNWSIATKKKKKRFPGPGGNAHKIIDSDEEVIDKDWYTKLLSTSKDDVGSHVGAKPPAARGKEVTHKAKQLPNVAPVKMTTSKSNDDCMFDCPYIQHSVTHPQVPSPDMRFANKVTKKPQINPIQEEDFSDVVPTTAPTELRGFWASKSSVNSASQAKTIRDYTVSTTATSGYTHGTGELTEDETQTKSDVKSMVRDQVDALLEQDSGILTESAAEVDEPKSGIPVDVEDGNRLYNFIDIDSMNIGGDPNSKGGLWDTVDIDTPIDDVTIDCGSRSTAPIPPSSVPTPTDSDIPLSMPPLTRPAGLPISMCPPPPNDIWVRAEPADIWASEEERLCYGNIPLPIEVNGTPTHSGFLESANRRNAGNPINWGPGRVRRSRDADGGFGSTFGKGLMKEVNSFERGTAITEESRNDECKAIRANESFARGTMLNKEVDDKKNVIGVRGGSVQAVDRQNGPAVHGIRPSDSNSSASADNSLGFQTNRNSPIIPIAVPPGLSQSSSTPNTSPPHIGMVPMPPGFIPPPMYLPMHGQGRGLPKQSQPNIRSGVKNPYMNMRGHPVARGGGQPIPDVYGRAGHQYRQGPPIGEYGSLTDMTPELMDTGVNRILFNLTQCLNQWMCTVMLIPAGSILSNIVKQIMSTYFLVFADQGDTMNIDVLVKQGIRVYRTVESTDQLNQALDQYIRLSPQMGVVDLTTDSYAFQMVTCRFVSLKRTSLIPFIHIPASHYWTFYEMMQLPTEDNNGMVVH